MYNETWKQALENLEKFWNREDFGRCALSVAAPLAADYNWYKAPESLEQKWLDEENLYQGFKVNIKNMYFAAEATALYFANLGPGVLSACVGGDYVLAENTVWFDRNPIITDWDNPPDIKFNEDSKMWGHVTRIQKRFLRDNDIGVPMVDLGGTLDILASLRGAQELLFDLYDCPEQVKEMLKRLNKIWIDAFDRQAALVGSTGLPYNAWMDIPSSKPWYPLQCDFCAMISPAQFEEFALPGLVEQASRMERSIYHLDGPGEIPHLDMILDIPGLTGIQWVVDPGKPPLWDECWFDMYRKIQDKKKNLVLLCGLPQHNGVEAERLIKTLDPVGLYISASRGSKAEADRSVEDVVRWSS